MKILVPVKRVIDYNVKVRLRADLSDVDLSNTKMAMNPFCEIALEEAVRLKEKGQATELIVVTVGPLAAQEQLRQALALGADRAVLIETDAALDAYQVACLLRRLVQDESPDLVLLGKQSIDAENNQTGQMLAALTDRPQAIFAASIELADGRALVNCEIDGGSQALSVPLPAVITADLRLNEPRYARLPDIMKAKKKPLTVLQAEDLGVPIEPSFEWLGVEPPAERASGVRLQTVEELVQKLKHEAKVIA